MSFKKEVRTIEFPQPPVRQRGRPRGHPKPLNDKEKRRRNALYERERRALTAEYLSGLAVVLGLQPKTKTEMVVGEAQLVLNQLKDEEQKNEKKKNILKYENKKLQAKLASLLKEAAEMQRHVSNSSEQPPTSENSSHSTNNEEIAQNCVEPQPLDIDLSMSFTESITQQALELDCTVFNTYCDFQPSLDFASYISNILPTPSSDEIAPDSSSDTENRVQCSESIDVTAEVNKQTESNQVIPSSSFDTFGLTLSPSNAIFSCISSISATPPEEIFEPSSPEPNYTTRNEPESFSVAAESSNILQPLFYCKY